jgi:PAT family beta-lactamase induction signal transducer AmpG
VIDAYRVELLPKEEQGTGAAWATFGYRIGMLVSGAGALAFADAFNWQLTYAAMAVVMGLSIPLTLLMREPAVEQSVEQGTTRFAVFIRDYVIAPFADFMTRPLWLAVLLFVILYKLGDAFMGTMFNPFLLDIGFTKSEIAAVVKLYGLIATILGTFAGGWLVSHAGTFRALLLCGFMHMLTNLLLVVQAQMGADVHFLAFSISLENFTGGMSTAAFIAYLSALTRVNYTATQYALLSSLAAFGRTWLATPSGAIAKALGWEQFFMLASLMALPGLALLLWLERAKRRIA